MEKIKVTVNGRKGAASSIIPHHDGLLPVWFDDSNKVEFIPMWNISFTVTLIAANNNTASGVPRRSNLTECHSSEITITKAMHEIEEIGADERLTASIIKLQEARELLSDYIDDNLI